MKEFVSVKVSSFDHAALATTLTTKSSEGWDVVSVVAVGNDIVAYLSRETAPRTSPAPTNASSTTTVSASATNEPSGWGAARTTDAAASAPTQVVATTAAVNTSSGDTGSTATSSTGTPSVPADWYKDPSGRYEYRYWDGQKWTEHVSRSGTVYKDPPTP
ncbi:MAG: hypothetical protein RL547_1419 [Actinomycetota bacterium]|jgi:hypothetical protein